MNPSAQAPGPLGSAAPDVGTTCRPWPVEAPAGPARLEQHATLLRLDGPDSLRFLHGQSSQDLQLARPGHWRRSCCLTPTARVTALVEVLADDAGAWLVITTGEATSMREQLDRVLFPADQVQLGPLEPVRLIELVPAPEPPSTPEPPEPTGTSGQWLPLDGDPEAGFRLGDSLLVLRGETSLPADVAPLPPLGADSGEQWRISQGRPALPGELNGESNPFELGLAARVSLSKGCYVGQETLARLVTYDVIKQQLRRWHWQGSATEAAAWLERLQPGQPLITPAGEKAGRITSCLQLEASLSPAESEPDSEPVRLIGLALVRRAALAEPWLTASTASGTTTDTAENGPVLVLSVPEGFTLPAT